MDEQKSCTDYTLEEYRNMECFLDPNCKLFNNVIIVPTGEVHDSGYGCMKFILANGFMNKIVGVVGGYSDVVALNGIGGYGPRPRTYEAVKSDVVKRVDWQIDCLPNSGCLRLYTQSTAMCLDEWMKSPRDVLSTFEVYSADTKVERG